MLHANPNVAPPMPKSMPAPVAAKITARRTDALRIAIFAGPAALLTFAKAEQAKRNETAKRDWKTYSLWTAPGRTTPDYLVTPTGESYEYTVSEWGVKRFVGCPDQIYVDSINAALDLAGVGCPKCNVYRVETKHAVIWHLLERSAWAKE